MNESLAGPYKGRFLLYCMFRRQLSLNYIQIFFFGEEEGKRVNLTIMSLAAIPFNFVSMAPVLQPSVKWADISQRFLCTGFT